MLHTISTSFTEFFGGLLIILKEKTLLPSNFTGTKKHVLNILSIQTANIHIKHFQRLDSGQANAKSKDKYC